MLTVTSAQIESEPIYVALLHDRLAGFYQLSRGDRVELEHMWVHPAWMRHGVGRALLTHAIQAARNAGANELYIDADPNAANFYFACGARRGAQFLRPSKETRCASAYCSSSS